jgi:hypothetical protein
MILTLAESIEGRVRLDSDDIDEDKCDSDIMIRRDYSDMLLFLTTTRVVRSLGRSSNLKMIDRIFTWYYYV